MPKNFLAPQAALLVVALSLYCICPTQADVISPQISSTTDPDRPYSEEKPDVSFYGSGGAGRMSEASALRFQGERDTDDAKYDKAIHELAKAVQLDPGDPTGHLLYARALSRKIRAHKNVSQELVANAINEWSLLWHHDADYSEQFEAKMQTRKLIKLAKEMRKEAKWQKKHGGPSDEFVAQKQKQDAAQ
ncbi:MAG TPA: hypothetical protein V6C69_22100 [Trichormus sp.]|jgi:hypothetical protein